MEADDSLQRQLTVEEEEEKKKTINLNQNQEVVSLHQPAKPSRT